MDIFAEGVERASLDGDGADGRGEALAGKRDEVDHAAHGAAAVDGGDRRAHDFDLVDVIEREIGEVIVGARNADCLAATVDGDERLVAVEAVNEDRGLRALVCRW